MSKIFTLDLQRHALKKTVIAHKDQPIGWNQLRNFGRGDENPSIRTIKMKSDQTFEQNSCKLLIKNTKRHEMN